ncbi:putative alpha/beta hydrolase family esterase [Robbsia andropogonis]|uniref:RBBP9/YdeN family alpha/beta hydrolase n=1 Tax=Robbsia andropogonis TaxID=28092 RepID=UPI0009E1F344|nr:alpha/beta hydrolase [Robbsia andropogonis]MCP1118833.1 alpha/beta hydrolase [Robbsia andropogonis]MCP1128300.1 alpha/beta hydrolase [Robbsia andropogonis]
MSGLSVGSNPCGDSSPSSQAIAAELATRECPRRDPVRSSSRTRASSREAVTVLIVPGLHGSGDDHWQTWLERSLPSARRVVQRDWAQPSLLEWSACVRDSIEASTVPVVLVGHSFGCLAIAEALRSVADRVAGALLVAPANPVRFDIDPARLQHRLPMTSVTVGSENDPWMAFKAVQDLAQVWGSSLINLGNAGHINVASGFGPWRLGRELTEMLCWSARMDVVPREVLTLTDAWSHAA